MSLRRPRRRTGKGPTVPRANIAVFLSGHGFGHLTRAANILEALTRTHSLSLHVITSAPSRLWPVALRSHTAGWFAEPCDAGVVQVDDLSVDIARTQRMVESWEATHTERRKRLVQTVSRMQKPLHLVLSDVPPLAFEVADALGVPSIAIANFSWDWIYDELGLGSAADSARRAYSKAGLLLELAPAAPMPAFARRRAVGTAGRDAHSRRSRARSALGASANERLVLLAFRGAALSRISLPPRIEGCRFIVTAAGTDAPANSEPLPAALEFLDGLAASDVVVAKTGYGILADCAATGRPLLWVAREGFPEDRILAAWLSAQPWARRIDRGSLARGSWGDELSAAFAKPAPAPIGNRAVLSACEAIAEMIS